MLFQSTHPLRGATLSDAQKRVKAFSISIHAPLAGCDHALFVAIAFLRISIHAPLAGCDNTARAGAETANPFQSTHPLRGATIDTAQILAGIGFQSTHPLRGATDRLAKAGVDKLFQSTHPLRGATRPRGISFSANRFQSTHPLRGATRITAGASTRFRFQSTHPLRGATRKDVSCRADGNISIHAPLAGCDPVAKQICH